MLGGMATSDLTDAQWERLRPLLPPQKPPTGRPANDHRTVINGILWVLRTGCPWRCRPRATVPGRRSPAASTAGRRRECGIGSWPNCNGGPTPKAGWTGRCTSSTAPSSGRTSTPPVPKGGSAAEALGRSRGGFTTKIHLRCERNGRPMVFVVTGGERHEQSVLPVLMEQGAVKRPGRGRPRIRPDRVAGDKGYSSSSVRRYLKERRIGAVIPTKADQPPDPAFDRVAYRERNVVERLINRLKQFRRIATRYEKRARNYHAMITIAAIMLWL